MMFTVLLEFSGRQPFLLLKNCFLLIHTRTPFKFWRFHIERLIWSHPSTQAILAAAIRHMPARCVRDARIVVYLAYCGAMPCERFAAITAKMFD